MSEVDNIAAKTRAQSIAAAEQNVAIYLKKAWPIIVAGASQKGKKLPDDPGAEAAKGETDPAKRQEKENAEWMRLAKEVIGEENDDPAKRGVSVGGVRVTLAELDEVMADDLQEMLQVDGLGKLVPTRKQINMIADTMAASAKRSTGTGIDFLDDWFGGASFGDILMGLFNWIFSGFEGGFDGLKTGIANNTGARMGTAVQEDLTKLADKLKGTPDDISAFMDPAAIKSVGTEVSKAPAKSLKPDATKPDAALTDAKIGSFAEDMRGKAKGMIQEEFSKKLGDGFRANDQFKPLYEDSLWEKAKSYIGQSERVAKRGALDKVQEAVSKRMAEVITSDTYKFETKDEKSPLFKLNGLTLRQMDSGARAAALEYESREAIKAVAAESEKNKEGLADFYALLTLSVPGQIKDGILESEKQVEENKKLDPKLRKPVKGIPWQVAGPLSVDKLVGVDQDAMAKQWLSDNAELKTKAVEALVPKMVHEMRDALYPGGKATEDTKKIEKLAGAELKPKHFAAVARAILPTVLDVNAKPGEKKALTDALASTDDAVRTKAMVDLAAKFEVGLKAKLGDINDKPNSDGVKGVQIDEKALRMMSMKMAQMYLESEKLIEKDKAPEGFKKLLVDEEKALITSIATVKIGAEMEKKKGDIQALASGPVDIDSLKKSLIPEAVNFIADEKNLKPLAKDLDGTKYSQAVLDLADKLTKKMNAITPPLPLSMPARMAMANEMAQAAIEESSGIPAPDFVKRRTESQSRSALVDFLKTNMGPELAKPELLEQLAVANGGKGVDTLTAGQTIANRLADELMRRKADIKDMSADDYRAMIVDMQKAIDKDRAGYGIADGKEGDVIRDVLVTRITKEAFGRIPGGGPKMPDDVNALRIYSEKVVAATVIKSMVRAEMLPKLTGTVSVTDTNKDSANRMIANMAAMDSSRSGTRVNPEKIIERVSNVILTHKLREIETGQAVDKKQLEAEIYGALSKEGGLGAVSAKALAPVLTEEAYVSLNKGKPGFVAPKKLTPDEAWRKNADMAEDMLKTLKAEARADFVAASKQNMKDNWDAWYALNDSKISDAADALEHTLEHVVRGNTRGPGDKDYFELNVAGQHALVKQDLHSGIYEKFKAYTSLGATAASAGGLLDYLPGASLLPIKPSAASNLAGGAADWRGPASFKMSQTVSDQLAPQDTEAAQSALPTDSRYLESGKTFAEAPARALTKAHVELALKSYDSLIVDLQKLTPTAPPAPLKVEVKPVVAPEPKPLETKVVGPVEQRPVMRPLADILKDAQLPGGALPPVEPFKLPDAATKDDGKRPDKVQKMLAAIDAKLAGNPKEEVAFKPADFDRERVTGRVFRPKAILPVYDNLTQTGLDEVKQLAQALKQRADAAKGNPDMQAAYVGAIKSLEALTKAEAAKMPKTHIEVAQDRWSDASLNIKGLIEVMQAMGGGFKAAAGTENWKETMQDVTTYAQVKRGATPDAAPVKQNGLV